MVARLPSVLATIATVLVVYLLARDLGGHTAGLLAGLALVTSARLMWVSRVAVLDPLLMLWVALVLYLFHRSYRSGGSWRGYLLAAVPAALGLLTKGPVAVVLPGVVIAVFLAWETVRRDRRALLRTVGRSLPAAALCLAMAAPWFVAVHLRTGGNFTLEFFVYHHLCRSGRIELSDDAAEAAQADPAVAEWTDYVDGEKRGSLVYHVLTDRGLDNRPFQAKTRWWFYLARIWVNTFPWSVFVPGALLWAVARRRRWRFESSLALPIAWLTGGVTLLSLMTFRKSEYLLPMYPALAVVVGVFLAEYSEIRGRSRFWDWLLRMGMIVLFVAAAALAGGILSLFSGAAHRRTLSLMGNENDRFMFEHLREQVTSSVWLTSTAVAVLLGGFAAALWLWLRGRNVVALAMAGAAVGLLFMGFVSVVVPVLDEGRSHRALAEKIESEIKPTDLVIAGCGDEHELYYLLNRAGIGFLQQPDGVRWRKEELVGEALRRASEEGRGAYLILRRSQLGRVELDPAMHMAEEEPQSHRQPLVLLEYGPDEDRGSD